MTDADPLLSSLCAVCHLNPHTYRCPRCSTLTCSLQCVKRHKKRAQCNGKRDPGAYVKISDLATPAGIDKDYNYITSIERELDNADRDAAKRGIHLESAVRGPGQRAWGKSNLQAGIEKSGVIVTKAPKGMSRNTTNSTSWLKGSGCLEWTVEWVHADGTKSLAQCKDNQPISKVYSALCDSLTRKKRKNEESSQDHKPRRKRRSGKDTVRNHGEDKVDVQPNGDHTQAASSTVKAGQSVKESHVIEIAHTNDREPDSSTIAAGPRFYLHCPSLPSRQTVLCPLKSEATLSTSLREKIVLEYPTIYVFGPTAEQPLPPRFIHEEEYYKIARKEKITELESAQLEDQGPEDGAVSQKPLGQLDPGRLAEVLGKDLGRP